MQTISHDDPLYFGKDILQRILSSTIEHEIGYHSFSHAIFSEIERKQAEVEIKAGVEIAKQYGLCFKSFVYPQNEIGHVDILEKYGFIIYRGRTSRYEKLSRISQKADGLINETIASSVKPERRNGIWEIRSSMMFCDPTYPFTLLPRAKLGLWRTIRSNMVFHIWMHPWNLLQYGSLSCDFEKFVEYVSRKRDEGKIDVMTMKGLAEHLNTRALET
jgi:hypothetical protein